MHDRIGRAAIQRVMRDAHRNADRIRAPDGGDFIAERGHETLTYPERLSLQIPREYGPIGL